MSLKETLLVGIPTGGVTYSEKRLFSMTKFLHGSSRLDRGFGSVSFKNVFTFTPDLKPGDYSDEVDDDAT
jgi:hypothetical protein